MIFAAIRCRRQDVSPCQRHAIIIGAIIVDTRRRLILLMPLRRVMLLLLPPFHGIFRAALRHYAARRTHVNVYQHTFGHRYFDTCCFSAMPCRRCCHFALLRCLTPCHATPHERCQSYCYAILILRHFRFDNGCH